MRGIPALRDKIDLLFGRFLYTRKIQTQDDEYGQSRDKTLSRTRVPDQQEKECYYTKQCSRIFGVQNQFERYADFSSSSEDKL